MKAGEVVAMKSAVCQIGDGVKLRGSATIKPNTKGHFLYFLALGALDPTKPAAEDGLVERFKLVLGQMGWVPGPALQAQFDAEVKDSKPDKTGV